MTTPKAKKKKRQSRSAKLKSNAAKSSKLSQEAENRRKRKALETCELMAEPAKGFVGKYHKYLLKSFNNPDEVLGVTDDLKTCNGIINQGSCTPFPVNITLILS